MLRMVILSIFLAQPQGLHMATSFDDAVKMDYQEDKQKLAYNLKQAQRDVLQKFEEAQKNEVEERRQEAAEELVTKLKRAGTVKDSKGKGLGAEIGGEIVVEIRGENEEGAPLQAGSGLAAVQGAELFLDRSTMSETFDGIGGISGGGATSVLLPDYSEPSRSQILDYLFTPNFGASLQILKVEIGGDSQSTDGTESSSMHSKDKVDLSTGYEWWLMQEAKKRNPDIKLYGLAWAFPGWVGNSTKNPFAVPDMPSRYLTEWVRGAKDRYGLDIDYLGIWNERASDSNFVQTLRKSLNTAGARNTKIVVKDGGPDICDELANDKAYADAVDVIGLHYPSDFVDYSTCHKLGKKFWAAEESSSYDDLNGAACWGRVLNSHWVLSRMTSSIMWNLVGSYYHGTDWYASSMMTAVEPWSGHYEVNPTIWATAHITQFTQIGWRYLAQGNGSGLLPLGGYYTTLVDPESGNFTLNVVKISNDHAACTRPTLPFLEAKDEWVTFHLAPSMKAPAELEVWYSNFEASEAPPLFEHRTVEVNEGAFTLFVEVGSMFTVTTVKTGRKGTFGEPPKSSPSFPLPYSDDFQSVPESQDAKFLADQIGSFEVHKASDGRLSLTQMVPDKPIAWGDPGTNGPQTILGMREWQDVAVSIDFRLPEREASHEVPDQACVAARADQMWYQQGIVVCINAAGEWSLSYEGPPLQERGVPQPGLVTSGRAQTEVGVGTWHTLRLVVQPPYGGSANSTFAPVDPLFGADVAEATLDRETLFADFAVRGLDTGFVAFGSNGWFPIEFRNLRVDKAARGWEPPQSCAEATEGDAVTVAPCARNGLVSESQAWTLLASYQLQHDASGLCASSTGPNTPIALARCDRRDRNQVFRHDYTLIRNWPTVIESTGTGLLVGAKRSGQVTFNNTPSDSWTWSYFPNTRQLRTQNRAIVTLGYPLCLSTCPLKRPSLDGLISG